MKPGRLTDDTPNPPCLVRKDEISFRFTSHGIKQLPQHAIKQLSTSLFHTPSYNLVMQLGHGTLPGEDSKGISQERVWKALELPNNVGLIDLNTSSHKLLLVVNLLIASTRKDAYGYSGEKGDTGLSGKSGLKGDPGSRGSPGPRGSVGPFGTIGETGKQGVSGPRGVTGNTGPQGPVGPSGLPGLKGVQGIKGDKGYQGPQGLAGLDGKPGPPGHPGPDGPSGEKGVNGARGFTGHKGEQGGQGIPGPQVDENTRNIMKRCCDPVTGFQSIIEEIIENITQIKIDMLNGYDKPAFHVGGSGTEGRYSSDLHHLRVSVLRGTYFAKITVGGAFTRDTNPEDIALQLSTTNGFA
ncbi:collagen alpha-3(IX) chain-like [Corticium candelabrum]|uniref:collagen alpha-3(IX) chain-like n=1 Tax=Corticium candelabrum TaxID=121492 RepID=UPI002E272087|nr:collagen alpha-3(IX) chain-like [Corticium candelabrum]